MQKIHQKKSAGFTLVEIMIVVTIIALLAAIALPNFLRARKRSQATRILNDLRTLDAAMDQYAMDTAKPSGFSPTFADIQHYLKTDTALYANGTDIMGDSYGPFTVDSIPQVSTSAFNAYSDVADPAFWGQFYTGDNSSAQTTAQTTAQTADQVAQIASGNIDAILAMDAFLQGGGNPSSTQGQALVAAAQQANNQMQQFQQSGQLPANMVQAYTNSINFNYNGGNSGALLHPAQ